MKILYTVQTFFVAMKVYQNILDSCLHTKDNIYTKKNLLSESNTRLLKARYTELTNGSKFFE